LSPIIGHFNMDITDLHLFARRLLRSMGKLEIDRSSEKIDRKLIPVEKEIVDKVFGKTL